jgi:hypothetical protein
MAVEGTMPAAIICFEGFRAERDRRRAGRPDGSAIEASPFRDQLASVILNARQIAHRRAMLEFGDQRRRVLLAPFREAATECE